MTDHTSPAPSDSDSIDPTEPSPSKNGPGSVSGEARYAVRPNLNPPASSVAVHAAIFRHPLWALTPQRGENPDPERGSEQVKCVPARAEAAFHGALNRRLALELTREPGERIGVMVEGGGAVEEIAAARRDWHEPEWRRAMAKKSFWQHGKDDAKKVSGKPIDEIQCGVAHDEERDTAQAENLDRHPAGTGVSQSERDWAWCLDALRRGQDPAIVRARLEERRADDEPNPGYYARRTVEGAVASLRRQIPGPEIER